MKTEKIEGAKTKKLSSGPAKIRFAVVGLGHISQVAVLPAFAHAKNSELVALISSDPKKIKVLSKKYKIEATGSYDQFEEVLKRANVNAVYIALPNSMHCEYTVRAAKLGIHVLCEKPMAPHLRECAEMIEATRANNVRLMIAYRLHFSPAYLEAIQIAKSGKLGELRTYQASFTMNVTDLNNIRLQKDLGGGVFFDVGIYALNQVRALFDSEPEEVFAFRASLPNDERFAGVSEMYTAILRFPRERLATITTSFGSAKTSHFELIGTKGKLKMDPAFDYRDTLKHFVTLGQKKTEKKFAPHDQFAAELVAFSNSILTNDPVEPSGIEGFADIQIIDAIHRSAETGEKVTLAVRHPSLRPNVEQAMKFPPVKKAQLIDARDSQK